MYENRKHYVKDVDHDNFPVGSVDQIEGSSNRVKEAIPCQLSVVSTAVGDVHKRLSGASPSTVGTTQEELIEGLIQVFKQGERSNSREKVKPLNWEYISDQIIKIYKRILYIPSLAKEYTIVILHIIRLNEETGSRLP